jgi:MarR family transcriptional regulator, lower aerobic nicotinate degradation pathway regulator
MHPALMRHTGFLLSRLGYVARKRFGDRLEEIGLNVRMWGAMNVLEHEGPMTQHALGKSVGIDPSSMVATIDELEAMGFVERGRHSTDRRAYAVQLTERGRETLTEGRKIARSAQEELLAPLDSQEREILHALLLRIAVAANPNDPVGAE